MDVPEKIASYRLIRTRRMTGALGAEVEGVDLSTNFGEEVMVELRAALLEHLVLFFRDQRLTPEQQLAFGRRWGELYIHPLVSGMDDHPEMMELKKTPKNKKNLGGNWHSDQMYAEQPVMATILYAKVVPSVGGDTLFSNQYLGYETLSPGMQRMLRGLRAVSYGDHAAGHEGKPRSEYYAQYTGAKTRDPGSFKIVATHPVVRTHPETKRSALYIGSHVQHFEDMTEDESRPLIDELMAHCTLPEFICRFGWREGSLAIWDNRCTQHMAINDYPSETRIMHRLNVCGDAPY